MTSETVIFNEEYIDEITRHRDLCKKKYEVENMPEVKQKYKQELDNWEKKLDWAINFQDKIDFIENMEVPQITVIKTISGYEIPAKNLQII